MVVMMVVMVVIDTGGHDGGGDHVVGQSLFSSNLTYLNMLNEPMKYLVEG